MRRRFIAFLLPGLLLLAPLALAPLTLAVPAAAQTYSRQDRPPPGRYAQQPRGQRYVPQQAQQEEPRGLFRIPFFRRLFGHPSQPQVVNPRDLPPVRRRALPGQQMAPPATAGAPAAPARPLKVVEQTMFVAVLGDSLADNLAQGLNDALDDRPQVGLVKEIRPGIGFLKASDKYWADVAREVAGREKRVNVAVIMMGPQDDKPSDPGKDDTKATTAPLQREAWMDIYASRVDEVMLAFRDKGIPVVWVGLPPVENEAISADYALLNDLVRQRITALGGTFVDVWEAFVDDDNGFTERGPDLDGQVVRLRSADGVHFNRAGARKLAHYVDLELRPYLRTPDEGEAEAEPVRTAPLEPGSSRIVLLNLAPRSANGVLISEKAEEAEADELTGASAADLALAKNMLEKGVPAPSRPGRADDFSWNKKTAP
jgi:hypothetical protein